MAHWAMSLAGLTAVVFAGLMVFQRSLYSSAICLLVVLFQVAVFFFFSGAPLLAFLQIMIYAGAVMILVVVMIMAAPAPRSAAGSQLSLPLPLIAAGLMVPLVEAAIMISRGSPPAGGPGGALAIEAMLGPVLFKPYAAATESVTLLMFLAGLALVNKKAAR